MYHLTLLLLVAALGGLGWMLVRSAPAVLSLVLPRDLTFALGALVFVFGAFTGFTAAFALRTPEGVLESLVTLLVGAWFLFSTSAALRGTADYEALLRRFGALMALLVGLILATLYVSDPRVVSLLSLGLIGAGLFATREYLRTR
ncbi:MAG TPA: hypothetical protein VNN10_09045 [Dehalococcoidia bacterium]|nr:hypothetical protein [Dehalococcoidia bacterium]